MAHLHVYRGELAKVTVVVALHFHVKDLGVDHLAVGDQHVTQQVQHVLADALQLRLNHFSVLVDQLDVTAALVRLSVLDGAHCAPGCAPAADRVFVRHREQVALLIGKLAHLSQHKRTSVSIL